MIFSFNRISNDFGSKLCYAVGVRYVNGTCRVNVPLEREIFSCIAVFFQHFHLPSFHNALDQLLHFFTTAKRVLNFSVLLRYRESNRQFWETVTILSSFPNWRIVMHTDTCVFCGKCSPQRSITKRQIFFSIWFHISSLKVNKKATLMCLL